MTLVSIVVPVFNRADIVHETIESVLAQTFEDWQLVLVDDGSTDDSVSILRGYASRDNRILVSSRPENRAKGANACRNHGLALSKGEFVKWVDSDDVLTKEALAVQLGEFRRMPELKVVFGQSSFFDATSREIQEPWSRQLQSDNILWDYVRNKIRWPIGAALWRKSFLTTMPFHESLRNSQEWLMHGLQLLTLKDGQYSIIADTVYLIRRGNVRMSSSRNATYYYNQALARKWFLEAASKTGVSFKLKFELSKQIAIYLFHSIRRRIS